ncbi:hypothetical protein BX286_7028 [Streptomyces sp. 3211.6]|uniref:toxin-antitoxin system, toxin component n=1 Tax=Streptomyces TaxID=1883 RepID=UPI000C2B5B81|nr:MULTISPECIES: toxin-antitoxin system, toxin component [Streptomyces]RKS97214.1 hypothetical protein BX286_7028 [Streptomyces sp. 3211.6]RPF25559.1 hypothetical protein EDD96_7081 [Streptomyces sp. Ag109_G2-6]
MFKQREIRQSVSAMVGGLGHLKSPVAAEVICLALCDAMSRRRGRKIEFRSTSFPPGTVSGLALNIGDRDLIIIEERTVGEHQIVITGHELRHLELGHCHEHAFEASAAARLLHHDGDLRQVVASALAVAGRKGPVLLEEDGTAARRHRMQEQAAERYGLELAHAVRHLLTVPDAPELDRSTRSGRIEAALCNHGIRG